MTRTRTRENPWGADNEPSSGCSSHGRVELGKFIKLYNYLHSAVCANSGGDEWQRGKRKLLGVMDTFIILIAGWIHRYKYISKLIKVHT